MKMETIKEFLCSNGLGKNEAEVYVALVEMGTSSVLEISKKVGIHRSNIYDILRKLLKEGLAYEINSETKYFCARPPENLLEYFKSKEIILKELIENYRKKNAKKEIHEEIRLSKGNFSLRDVLFSLLEYNEPIHVWGIPNYASHTIGPIIKEFHSERIKRKIPMKHIYNSDAKERSLYLNTLKYTESRILPHKYDSFVSTIVCSNKVVIIIWNDEIDILEIINEQMAEPYFHYFEIIWGKAKVLKPKDKKSHSSKK